MLTLSEFTGSAPRRKALAILSLGLAALIWLPLVHLLFASASTSYSSSKGVPLKAREMAKSQLGQWKDASTQAAEVRAMRRSNAEWDFMGRTFLVLSLAEMCFRDPALNRDYLTVIDRIVEETLRAEREHGMHFFLMPYSRSAPFREQPERSLFIDGEIACMAAARRMVEENESHRTELKSRVRIIESRLRRSPFMAAESYPNECWLFDHAMALAAIRLSDHLEHEDHRALMRDWVARARKNLIHAPTGLLCSSYTTEAGPLDGPEGSSLWLSAHCLRLVDETLAREQYDLARRWLERHFCGFAWSREWPVSWKGPTDIDSGAVIPILDIGAGASGLAFVGASSFGDSALLQRLHTTVEFAAFPARKSGGLRYCASNPVGDSVILYSTVLGPMWNKVLQGPP
ncbi:MAG: hypothetical protein HYR88_04605 [Verrucomicrobia bacterium]|nr:hypothetical protein [Verrucomicrobiota bacterium]MBI3867080.1 hypothetical protein [Verrucomicrobiota bacterium]